MTEYILRTQCIDLGWVKRGKEKSKWKKNQMESPDHCLSALGKYNSPLKQITGKVEGKLRERTLKAYPD